MRRSVTTILSILIFVTSAIFVVGPTNANSLNPVKAVVLDSFGTDDASDCFWDYLNANWAVYGSVPIVIDYTSLNKEGITLADIEATQADVLIISDAWYAPWEFTDSEIQAIKTYVRGGHGIIATSGTFDTWTAPNNRKLADLFGMDPTITYQWGFDGTQISTTGTFNLLTPRHDELWRNVPDPYLSGGLVTLNPIPSSDWTVEGVTTGWIEALSTDHYAAVIANVGATHRAVYFTTMLEYHGQNNENNRQLFYNAIVARALVATGWGVMWGKPQGYVRGPAALYRIGEAEMELVVTFKGEEYSKTWEIREHYMKYKWEIFECFNPDLGFFKVQIDGKTGYVQAYGTIARFTGKLADG